MDNTQIKAYLCPSDPNATSNTSATTGCRPRPTTATSPRSGPRPIFAWAWRLRRPASAANPTAGLFAFQQSKSIARVIDGTSNSIAFAESTVGVPGQTAKQKLIGLVNVAIPAAGAPGERGQQSDRRPGGDRRLLGGLAGGLELGGRHPARRFMAAGGDVHDHVQHHLHPQRPVRRMGLLQQLGSGACSNISNADSYHPGGVNVLMGDGSVKFIKNSINQHDLVGPGIDRRG